MNINGDTEVLGIIGNPVRHTKSPAMHNYVSERVGRNIVYVPFEVKGDIGAAVKGAYELNIKGLNVTVPYKTDVIPFLSDIDDTADRIGAVNTLVRTDKGYKGYNTDMTGLMRAIASDGIDIGDKTAVILGAGGAARAVAFMCVLCNVKKLYILNRTVSKAEAIADDVRDFIQSEEKDIQVFTLSINEYDRISEDELYVFQCTKIGLSDTDGAVIDDTSFYKKINSGVDLIYRNDTKFQRLVKENGGVCVNGLKMLLYQGIVAYELWNDIKLDDDTVNGALEILKGE